MKQQASLLSFFGKGKGAKNKRPASDCSGGGGGEGSSAPPSRQRSPARKQAKRASGTCTKIDDGASADGAGAPRIGNNAPVKSIEEETPQKIAVDDPAASCNDNGSAENAGAPSYAMTQSSHDNEAKAPSPPSPATDATGATESSDSEEESDDDSSASSSDSDADANEDASNADNTNGEGKSAYELLRERNIARNNARLKELGLLSGVITHGATSNNTTRRSRPRKKAKSANNGALLPTRRSSRLQKLVGTERGTGLGPSPSYEEVVAQKASEVEAEAEEEQFTVSPLFEYKMSSDNCKSTMPNTTDASAEGSSSGITTLDPKGPRLVPPSGLNAIYSLQFHPESWESASDSGSGGNGSSWLVGAGKSGLIALWDCSQPGTTDDAQDEDEIIEPVISWKGHGGRWVADARFLPPPETSSSEGTSAMVPSRLLTAANDGTVCHWDLTSTSVQTGVPKLLDRSGKTLHASGIFSMDVRVSSNGSGAYIVTGSKDKTLAVSRIDGLDGPMWRSDFHSAKVGSVCFSASHLNPLIASASDDGLVGIHDARLNGLTAGGSNGVVAKLEDAHVKPHSAVWRPGSDSVFMTAGLDEVVKLWDLRNASSPIASYHGHVPGSGKRLKRIHRPAFYNAASSTESFILSGGEGSHAISMFQLGDSNESSNDGLQSVLSRGKLPEDVGDVGSLTVWGTELAVAVEGGEVLMLSPGA